MSTWESEMTKEEWESVNTEGQRYVHIYIKGERIEMPSSSGAPLTEQQYIDKLGLTCPNCYKTEGVDAWDRAEIDDGVAWQNISCSLCEADWVDNYSLVGYSDLEIPDNDSTK